MWRQILVLLAVCGTSCVKSSASFQVKYTIDGVPTDADGQLLTESETAPKPQISFPGASSANDFFTVIMYDPDAPSPENPTCKNWLHWIYVNAKGAHLTGGKDAVAYAGPTPPIGTHHYHVSVLLQSEENITPQVPKSRCKFDVDGFASDYGLVPKAEVVFKVAVKKPVCVPENLFNISLTGTINGEIFLLLISKILILKFLVIFPQPLITCL